MNKQKILKKTISISIILISLLSISKISFASENCYVDGNKYIKEVILKESEYKNYINSLEDSISMSGEEYSKDSINLISESEKNKKTVTQDKQIEKLFNTNDEEKIKKEIDKTLEYKDEEYVGTLNLKDISISSVYQGEYEKIEDLYIEFKDFDQNELANIDKVIEKDGYTWNLIDVKWDKQVTELVDSTEVTSIYEGTMHYQRIATYPNPLKYKVKAIYEGEVEKEDKEYTYEIIYNLIEHEENTNLNLTPILIGAIGILIVLIALLVRKNCCIYKIIENGTKEVGKINLKENNLEINMNKIKNKNGPGLYLIKIKPNFFKKIEGKNAYLIYDNKKDKISLTSNSFNIKV